MKTLICLTAACGAVLFGGAASAAVKPAAPMAAVATVAVDNQDRRVNIVNQTGFTIMEFYASSVGQNNWQEDILGANVLPAGRSVVVNIDDGTGYCLYDLKAVFEDGDEAVKYRVNVCEISTFNFTP